MIKRILPFAVLAASAIGLAGCGASANPSSGATAKNKPLVVVQAPIGTYAENFNPYSAGALNGTLGPIYETLFYYNILNGHVKAMLGTHYAWSKGNTVLTVSLRSGVKWSNGQALTAKDVLFTFDMLKKFPALDGNGIWAHLASVQTVGSNSIQFTFKKADVPFAWYVLGQTYIVPKKIWQSVANPATYIDKKPVGTGPYLLKSFNPQEYVFSANPHYWGGEPKVHTVQFPAYTSNQSVDLALASGKIGWSGSFIPNINRIYVKKSPTTNHYWFPPYNIVMLYTNLKNPLLSQLPVRQAMSDAINRTKLYKVAEYGYEPPATPQGLVMPTNKAWMNPSTPKSQQRFHYNPKAAVKILEKAGFKKNAQGIFVSPSGKPLSFTLNVVSGWTDWDTDAALVASELGKVGIHVHVNEESYGAYYSGLTSGKYQMAISWTNPGPNPYYLLSSLLSSHSASNWENWRSSKTSSALHQFQQSSSLAVQKQAMYTLENQMAKNLPSIPLVEGATWYEYNTKNFTGWPTSSNQFAYPAPWSYPAMEQVLLHLKPR